MVNYYQMMDTEVLSEAQQFQMNAIFEQHGGPPQIERTVKSVLDDRFPN